MCDKYLAFGSEDSYDTAPGVGGLLFVASSHESALSYLKEYHSRKELDWFEIVKIGDGVWEVVQREFGHPVDCVLSGCDDDNCFACIAAGRKE